MSGRRWLRTGVLVAACLVAVGVGLLLNRGDAGQTPSTGDVDGVEQPGRTAVGSTGHISSAPVPARVRTHGVWSGSELLVWSGATAQAQDRDGTGEPEEASDLLDDGAAYDPATDSWRLLPAAPIPARVGAAAVWAGDRLVVWGGFGAPDGALADGAAYVPGEDRWVRMSQAPLSGRGDATAVWTGQEVLIVGGADRPGQPGHVSGVRRDGAAYDPATDEWRTLAPIPDGVWPLRDRGIGPIRERFAATWTGETLFVWGRDVGLYDPADDGWRRVSAPPARHWLGGRPQAVSTGTQVAVIGVVAVGEPRTFGLASSSRVDSFASIPGLEVGDMNGYRQAVAAGDRVVVLLPESPAAVSWRPGQTAWQSLPTALAERTEATVAWTGETLLVWGGHDGDTWRTDGMTWIP